MWSLFTAHLVRRPLRVGELNHHFSSSRPTRFHDSSWLKRRERHSEASIRPSYNAFDDALAVIKEDMKSIHQVGNSILQQYIPNQEMRDIATYYYKTEDDKLFTWTGLSVLIGKILRYHMSKDATLSEIETKIASIVELAIISYILHDDLSDSTKIRFNVPSANVLWDASKVALTGNMIFSIVVSETAKLSDELMVVLNHMNEAVIRGQYLTDMKKIPGENRMAQYIMCSDYKAGTPASTIARAVAKSLGASYLTTENISRMMFNTGMAWQMVDDYKDIKVDLKDGVATAAVLFAKKEHPAIEEMILRNFKREGDVERTMEFVRNSNAMEETRELAKLYFSTSKMYLKMFAPSPYRDTFEMLTDYQMTRKMISYESK